MDDKDKKVRVNNNPVPLSSDFHQGNSASRDDITYSDEYKHLEAITTSLIIGGFAYSNVDELITQAIAIREEIILRIRKFQEFS